MKKTGRMCGLILSVLMLALLSACNKKDDELVLVTTEATTTQATTATTTEELVTEVATEEASDKDKGITYQDMYDANRGDVLLSGGKNYSINTIYYANEKETFSEFQFLGFDNQGMYSQAYEDSDGNVEILDAANSYWYLIKDNKLSILIYPEPLVAAAIIDSNHNSMIFGLSGREDGTEIVQDVYRKEGKLLVETVYGNSAGENLLLEYALNDNWIVEDYYCYDMDGHKLSYSFVTEGATYDVPQIVTEAMAMEQGYRTITITYVDGDQLDMTYYTPVDVPVELSLIEYVAYSDQACTTSWTEVESDENGAYMDVTIYMKKNTKEGE